MMVSFLQETAQQLKPLSVYPDDPYKSQGLYMESEKYQGSHSACPTPRFKSRSTHLKDLLFAWWKELEAENQETVLSPTSNLTLDKKAT